MKVILYNAISIDGFIATPDGNSDWVAEADIPFFEKEIEKAGCIIIGRKTFEQYEGELYPVKNVTNIVLTSKPNRENKYENVLFTDKPLKEVLQLAEEKGFKNVLLVGGGTVNGSFLDENLIDEIIVDIHPIVLGKGIKLFEANPTILNYEKVSCKNLESDLTLIRYKKKLT